MAKKIFYNGSEYPLQFNFLVFKNWELATGQQLSELGNLATESGAVGAVSALTLLYFAVKDACEEQKIDFSVELNSFIRSIKPEQFKSMVSLISLSDGEELENKGQPKPKTAKR